MPQIINVILTTIAPIILVAGLGALLDRTKMLEARSISRVAIYLTSPALAFYGIANATMSNKELAQLLLFFLLSSVVITVLAWLVTRLFRMSRLTASAFVLSVSLMNIANYGIPLNEFAFGQPGLERALVITVAGALYAHTVGVFLASWGRASLMGSIKNMLRVPTPYAAGLGLVVNQGYLALPDLLMRIIVILQGAAVPLMLIMLGIQVARVSVGRQWRLMLGASGMRLIGGGLVGWGVAWGLGLEGITQQVAIVETAMPTAVISAMLATEFESDAELTSGIILVSTLLSIGTLSVLLVILQ